MEEQLGASSAGKASKTFVDPLRDPKNPPLAGNELDVINKAALALLIVVPIVVVLALFAENLLHEHSLCYRKYRAARHPALWATVLSVASYATLMPGLMGPLFSFNLVANIFVAKIGLGPGGGTNKTDPTMESVLGLIHLLHTTGSHLGAIMVATYAILIPAVKFLLLIVGECLRETRKSEARICLQVVQNISKWACPDMLAYVLLMYLFREMNHPELLRAAGQLDIGFACFSVFCVGSTIAAMGYEIEDKERGTWRRLAKALGTHGVLFLVVPLVVVFTVLIAFGMYHPVMALRVNVDKLYDTNGGPIPISDKDLIESLQIPELTKCDVSIQRGLRLLLEWVCLGEVNSFIGFVLLAVFCIGFTVLDMVTLAVSAVLLFYNVEWQFCGPSPLHSSWVFKKLSMLDVTLVGTVVVTLCMAIYKDEGIEMTLCSGFGYLLGAEVIHYFTYYMVKGAAQYYKPKANFAWSDDASSTSSTADDSESTSDPDLDAGWQRTL